MKENREIERLCLEFLDPLSKGFKDFMQVNVYKVLMPFVHITFTPEEGNNSALITAEFYDPSSLDALISLTEEVDMGMIKKLSLTERSKYASRAGGQLARVINVRFNAVHDPTRRASELSEIDIHSTGDGVDYNRREAIE